MTWVIQTQTPTYKEVETIRYIPSYGSLRKAKEAELHEVEPDEFYEIKTKDGDITYAHGRDILPDQGRAIGTIIDRLQKNLVLLMQTPINVEKAMKSPEPGD